MKKAYIYRINTGSCNGCDVELLATALVPKFGFSSLACDFTNSPEEANIVLVTGPITTRSSSFLKDTLSRIPEGKVVIAAGICPISCGVFRDTYSIEGPLDNFVDVDVNIPGCPPSPTVIVEGFIEAKRIWDAKHMGAK